MVHHTVVAYISLQSAVLISLNLKSLNTYNTSPAFSSLLSNLFLLFLFLFLPIRLSRLSNPEDIDTLKSWFAYRVLP